MQYNEIHIIHKTIACEHASKFTLQSSYDHYEIHGNVLKNISKVLNLIIINKNKLK